MRFEVVSCALILSVVVVIVAVDIKPDEKKPDSSRLFVYSGTGISFTTFTVVKRTTTTTATLTSTTTCTTSTTTLSTCTPSGGRRRRGLFYNADDKQGRARRGLFYDEEEAEQKDGSIFLPSTDKKSAADPVQEVVSTTVDESSVIPLQIQDGFSLPQDSPANRFLLAFATYTATVYTISTSTSSLTAICSSTTGFAICASSG